MNPQEKIRLALSCLQFLSEQAPASAAEVRRHQAVSVSNCEEILCSLTDAGLVNIAADGRYSLVRSIEEITSLELIQAVWKPRAVHGTLRLLAGRADALEMLRSFARLAAVGAEEVARG